MPTALGMVEITLPDLPSLATSRNKLTTEQKKLIVQLNACDYTPTQMRQIVAERFGVAISLQGCESYNPLKFAGRRLRQPLCDLFFETRRLFDQRVAKQGADIIEAKFDASQAPLFDWETSAPESAIVPAN